MNLSKQPYEQRWRSRTAQLASRLDRTRVTIHRLAPTLETGDSRLAEHRYGLALRDLESLVEDIKAFRSDRPPAKDLDEATAAGSMLALRGSVAAAVALDVMVEAMTALPSVDEERDAEEELIGACIDATQSYEESRAIVRAASQAHGAALWDLQRAFDTEGEIALRERVAAKRAAVHTSASSP
jgi:hypothetical protein